MCAGRGGGGRGGWKWEKIAFGSFKTATFFLLFSLLTKCPANCSQKIKVKVWAKVVNSSLPRCFVLGMSRKC